MLSLEVSGGAMGPPVFGRSVNLFSTGKGGGEGGRADYDYPIKIDTPRFSDPPTALQDIS